MPFTKTTIRALAASIALVAAGGTIAAAAVFQLPILGFGGSSVAGASAAPAAVKHVAAPHKVKPRVIVKTRYVTDIVHRPAPARAYAPRAWQPPAAPAVFASAPAPTVTAPATLAPTTAPTSPTTAAWSGEDGHDSEHEVAPATGHTTDTASVNAPAVDQ